MLAARHPTSRHGNLTDQQGHDLSLRLKAWRESVLTCWRLGTSLVRASARWQIPISEDTERGNGVPQPSLEQPCRHCRSQSQGRPAGPASSPPLIRSCVRSPRQPGRQIGEADAHKPCGSPDWALPPGRGGTLSVREVEEPPLEPMCWGPLDGDASTKRPASSPARRQSPSLGNQRSF